MRRKKYKRGRKKKKWRLILGFFIGIVIVAVIVAVLYQGSYQGQQEHKEAKEYFEITDATVIGGEPQENGSTLIIRLLSFNLTPVGGNATWVTVNHKGFYGGEPVDLGNMTKGESRWVLLSFQSPIDGWLFHLEEEGFPVEIPVFCEEAKGVITIYIPKET